MNVQLISISSSWMYTLPMTLSLFEEYANLDADLQNINYLPYIFHTYESSVLDYVPTEPVDVVGATLYIWNVNRTLKLLKEIKKNNPDCIVIVGGGNAPYYDREAEDFLRTHTFIDFIIHKEGELPFTQILKYAKGLLEKDQINSVSYIENNIYKKSHLAKFITLDTPSPYKNKNFLRTIDEVDNLGLLRGTVWETNRGCPYSCTYCDWGGLVQQKIRQIPDQRLYDEMEFLVKNMDEVFFGDANFGIFQRDVDIANHIVHLYETLENPRLKILHTGNAKNTTERVYQIGKIFSKYNLQRSGVSLSLQTYTEEALKNVKRDNIKKETYQELTKRFISEGIPVYTDMIINLPGETFESYLDSLEIVLEGDVVDIRTFLVEMYPNSEISQEREKFKLKTRKNLIFKGAAEDENEYTEQIYETYSMTEKESIKIRKLTIMIDVLHQGKYFYFIAKYLKKQHGIRYVDFYLNIFNNGKGLLKLLSNDFNFLEKYNNGELTKAGPNPPYNINWDNNFRRQQYIWTVIATLKDELYTCIKPFLKIDADLLEDLIKFQKEIMIDASYDFKKGKTIEYKYNWFEYFFENKILEEQINRLFYNDTHIGTLSERVMLDNPSIFMKYAAGGRSYFTQRQGSYIHQSIKKL